MATNDVHISLPQLFPSGTFTELTVANSIIAFEDSNPTALQSNPIAYCLPGIGDIRHSYRFLAPFLQNTGFRVIVQDLRGVGDSGTTFNDYTIESIALDVITVLDALHIIQPIILIVNSLTAACAVTLAAEHSNRIGAIISFGGFFRDMPKDKYFRPLSYLLFNRFWGQLVWTHAYQGFFAKPPSDLPTYIAAVKEKMLSNCAHAGIIGQMIRATKQHAWTKISSVKAPVLLIMGSRDPDFEDPVQETDFVASQLSSSRFATKAIIDGAGHYPHVESTEEVAPVIIKFLQDAGLVPK